MYREKLRELSTRTYLRFIRPNANIIWAIVVGLLAYEISRLLYFRFTPLFGYKVLGEVIVAIAFFLTSYYFGYIIITSIGSWIELVVSRIFYNVLAEFWRSQSQRMVDAVVAIVRREDEEKTNGAAAVKTKKPDFESDADFFKGAVLLDTSSIIDGRILGVIQTGFLDSRIVVPQNVIDELQYMADKSNAIKRQKGRRGLDILKAIRRKQGKAKFKVVDLVTKPEEVDKSLVQFCKEYGSKIATVDYNLNKVAQVANIRVLNINELANEVKTNLIPGEVLQIKLVQEGKEDGQAIGYLEDGTMIVVKDGFSRIGDSCDVVVEKVLQTNAGRMIFAYLPVEV